MSEADRPIGVRLSILDRERSESDLPADPNPSVKRWIARVEDSSAIRLALDHLGTRIYLAPRGQDGFTVLVRHRDNGGSGLGSLRSVFETHGAVILVSSTGARSGVVVVGIVPDIVSAVRVDDRLAVLANNAFVVDMPSGPGAVVLSTPTGERRIGLTR
jgi:hypothetical protein